LKCCNHTFLLLKHYNPVFSNYKVTTWEWSCFCCCCQFEVEELKGQKLAAVLYDKDTTGEDDFLGRYTGTCMNYKQQWSSVKLRTLHCYPLSCHFVVRVATSWSSFNVGYFIVFYLNYLYEIELSFLQLFVESAHK
jgi:hypothetical protein